MKVKKLTIDGKEVSVFEHIAKAEFKAVDGEGEGIIEAYVSIFGNVDHAGEVVEKGAFTESLARKLPKVVHSHEWDEMIGKVIESREDEKGLYCKFQLVLGVQRAKEDYELMKAGAIDEFSIGYSIDEDTTDEQGIRHLKKLTLYEISPVLVGCNPKTELLSVKGVENEEEKKEEEKEEKEEKPEEAKSGRVLSGKNKDIITAAVDALKLAAKTLEDLLEASEGTSEPKDGKQVDAQAPRVKNLVLKEVQNIAKQTNKVLFRLKRM